MNAIGGWNHAIGEAHAPGKRSGPTVVAVTGKEAADSADGVTERRRRRARVEKFQQRKLRSSAEQQHGSEAAEEATKPREAIAAEKEVKWIGKKFCGRFQ